MDGVAAAIAAASGSAGLTALVPASRIAFEPLAQATRLPAIGFSLIAATRLPTVAREASRHVNALVQATVHAATAPAAAAVLRALIDALDQATPDVAGIANARIVLAGEGPDGFDPASQVHQRTHDFRVFYTES